MKPIGTQVIETDRLILRPIRKEDGLYIYKNWANDPDVTRFLTWDEHLSVKDSTKFAEFKQSRYDENIYDWIVVLKNH